MPDRVVYDCNVFVQALISPSGPAGDCVDAAASRRVLVFASERILAEVQNVTKRSHLVRRFRLSDQRVEQFLGKLRSVVRLVDDVPHVFSYQRDPKDEHYVDLAVGAHLVVSRDRDLLALADPNDPTGRDFQTRFPDDQRHHAAIAPGQTRRTVAERQESNLETHETHEN